MSTQTDSAGTVFDPALHQVRGGAPLVRKKDGRFVLKGKRTSRSAPLTNRQARELERIAAAKRYDAEQAQTVPARADNTIERAAGAAQAAPRIDAGAAPSGVPALPPLEIAKATAEELLGEFAEPTIAPGETAPSETEPAADAPDTPADDGQPAPSTLGADAPPAPAPGQLTNQGLAVAIVSAIETHARFGIDDAEWKFERAETDELAGSMQRILEKHDINPDLSPEGDFALKLGMMMYRRAPLPKTRAWLGGIWAGVKRLFGPKKAPVVPADKAPAAPAQPAQVAPAAVVPAPPREPTIAEQYPV